MDSTEILVQMRKLIGGYQVSQVLRAVADLSIADHLEAGPLRAEEIAIRENAVADNVVRLMRAAVAIGLLTADKHDRFYTTPLLDTLRRDAPQSLRGWVMACTGSAHWLSWNEMVDVIRTGANAAQRALGSDVFTYFHHHPEEGREFLNGMSAMTSAWASCISQLIDTSGVSCAVDVGGGDGSLLALLQQANPALHGIIFERPQVAAAIKRQITESDVGDRTEVVSGDFFDAVPTGDLYLLKMILRLWDSSRCIEILKRCREAMRPGGRIVIVEQIVKSSRDPGICAALSDLNVLTLFQVGRERTLPQFDALLEAAGLRRTMVFWTGSPHSVIEAVAA